MIGAFENSGLGKGGLQCGCGIAVGAIGVVLDVVSGRLRWRLLGEEYGEDPVHRDHFLADGVCYGVPDPDWGTAVRDERETRLGDLVSGAGTRIGYTYDFGDDWEHDILIEQVVTAGEGEHYPRFLAGEAACPPEDCGGWPGYERLRGVLADPHHPERESMLDWLGLDRAASFDPGDFDAERANAALARIG